MEIQKVVRAEGEFAKKGEHIKSGDTVTIKNEGQWVDGQYGQQLVMSIECTDGETRNVNFNQTTQNILHDELGKDSKEWVGKDVLIRAKKDVVGGKKVEIYYFVTPNWDFDEYRELVNVSQDTPQKAQTSTESDVTQEDDTDNISF